jgi:predicted metal-dependent hydrolase
VFVLAHLLEPTHNDRFRGLMDQYLPSWRSLRAELNRAPVAHEDWDD